MLIYPHICCKESDFHSVFMNDFLSSKYKMKNFIDHLNGNVIVMCLLQCMVCDDLKSIINLCTFFRTCLKICNISLLLTPFQSKLFWNHSLFAFINLVSNHNKWKVIRVLWCCLKEKLLLPLIQVLKWFCIGHIKDKNTAVSTPIENRTKTSKPLLSCSVPYLQ